MWSLLRSFSAGRAATREVVSPRAAAPDARLPRSAHESAEPLPVIPAPGAGAPRRKDKARPKSVDTLLKKAQAAAAHGDEPRATAHLESVLRIEPAHVHARAELGRMRFAAPPQPLLDEIRSKNPVDLCEVVVEVRNPCNYRCHYCVSRHNDRPVMPFDLDAIRQALAAIRAPLVVTSFDCGGGEPTIHPQFPELLRICAERGPVSFPTNNSQNPARWLPGEMAGRVYIRAAIHPEGELKLHKYVQHARYLIEAGCEFSSIFVSHPTRMHKIPEYRAFFAQMGVPFTPVSFIGEYEGRRYPHAYSDEEKQMLGLDRDDRSWFHKIEPQVTRIRNFRGIPCVAGHRSVFIAPDGTVRRCRYDKQPLPRPLASPEPCRVKACGCGLFLEKLNVVESVEFHNSWAPKAGLPAHDVSWIAVRAQELGYASVQDGLAIEHARMYDALMSAYGKDEFPEP
jgi:sulfatase maturation enzyme AslB (radical SAM superfamily)